MWHWNSLWVPPRGDKPAADDTQRPPTAWSSEHAMAMQSHAWDSLLGASRAWWTFWLAALPLPQHPGEVEPPEQTDASPGSGARTAARVQAGEDADEAAEQADEDEEAEPASDAEQEDEEDDEPQAAAAPAPRRARSAASAATKRGSRTAATPRKR